MEARNLKNILIEQIQSIEDEKFLGALMVLTESKLESEKYQLSSFERQKIAIARQQYYSGEFTSHEETEKDLGEWLKSE